ncbi:MAG: carbohydrate-binding family 9-like protein, partial [Planctomycetota bacterium]
FKLDGKQKDACWKDVKEYDLKEVIKGDKTRFNTTFKMFWADSALYMAIKCYDSDMKNLNNKAFKDGDMNIWEGDSIELLIETQVNSYYQIAISPTGAIVDLDRKKGVNLKWDSDIEVVTSKGKDYWLIEARLPIAAESQAGMDPLNNVCGSKPGDKNPFYFNLCRQRRRGKDYEFSTFSPTGVKNFHRYLKFGKLTVK